MVGIVAIVGGNNANIFDIGAINTTINANNTTTTTINAIILIISTINGNIEVSIIIGAIGGIISANPPLSIYSVPALPPIMLIISQILLALLAQLLLFLVNFLSTDC